MYFNGQAGSVFFWIFSLLPTISVYQNSEVQIPLAPEYGR